MSKVRIILIIVLALAIILIGGWFFMSRFGAATTPSISNSGQSSVSEDDPETSPPTLANPASVNCGEKGGTLTMATQPGGGQYGVCTFADNMQCEEWAMLRGECPVGGVSIAGYSTPEQVYCAISGGEPQAADGMCSFANGVDCTLDEFYSGVCSSGATFAP